MSYIYIILSTIFLCLLFYFNYQKTTDLMFSLKGTYEDNKILDFYNLFFKIHNIAIFFLFMAIGTNFSNPETAILSAVYWLFYLAYSYVNMLFVNDTSEFLFNPSQFGQKERLLYGIRDNGKDNYIIYRIGNYIRKI